MVSTVEAEKATLVSKAAVLASQLFDPADQVIASRFIARFYEHVPPADVAERTPRNLYGAAQSLWRFGGRRRRGQAKIRIYNPDTATDGWCYNIASTRPRRRVSKAPSYALHSQPYRSNRLQ